jgi:hypothetical protein
MDVQRSFSRLPSPNNIVGSGNTTNAAAIKTRRDINLVLTCLDAAPNIDFRNALSITLKELLTKSEEHPWIKAVVNAAKPVFEIYKEGRRPTTRIIGPIVVTAQNKIIEVWNQYVESKSLDTKLSFSYRGK